jgi:dolichol-phosphate mannosyltransferase
VGSTILELKKIFKKKTHYLVVDGNSSDATVNIATNLRAQVVQQNGIGKGNAIANALKHIDPKTKYVVFIDADFTYPAEYVKSMLEILEEYPNIGMVTGNRFSNHLKFTNMNYIFYFGNRLITLIHRLLNGINLQDPLTGLRIVRWEILKNWNPKSQGFDIEVELNYYVSMTNFKIVEIPICYRIRLGKKKLSFKHGFSILQRILIQSIK